MEALTFSDARVKPNMDGMLLLQADVSANTAEHKALLKRFLKTLELAGAP